MNTAGRAWIASVVGEQRPLNVTVIPGMGQVWGVAVAGSELFVARQGASHVEVYDRNNLTAITRQLKISDLPLDYLSLAICLHHNCLYLCIYKDQLIYRVKLADESVTQWAVNVLTGCS